MIKILLEQQLKENRFDANEFPKEKGWQFQQVREIGDDTSYPTGDGFVEVLKGSDGGFNLNFSHPYNYSIGVINMTPIQKTKDGPIYEEYINETATDPVLGLDEMKKHIAPGRAINFGFVGSKKNRTINVLFVSIDGDEARMFVRTLN